jgi:hypothetical protein
MTTEESLAAFEELLKKLKVQYHLFFVGSRKVPPLEDRKRCDRIVQEFARMRIRDNAVRFRFSTLLSRYNQLQELWNRQTREREEGPMEYQKRVHAYEEAEEHIQDASQEKAAPPPPRARVTSDVADSYVQVTASNGNDAMERLHEQLAAANQQLGKAPLPLEQVRAMIQKQADTLRERYGVEAVAFRVEIVDDKIKLKAKPVQGK